MYAAIGKRSAWFAPVLVLLVETGMRRSELLSIGGTCRFRQQHGAAFKTKNTHPRRIPLTPTE
jgi:hypothetical protein